MKRSSKAVPPSSRNRGNNLKGRSRALSPEELIQIRERHRAFIQKAFESCVPVYKYVSTGTSEPPKFDVSIAERLAKYHAAANPEHGLGGAALPTPPKMIEEARALESVWRKASEVKSQRDAINFCGELIGGSERLLAGLVLIPTFPGLAGWLASWINELVDKVAALAANGDESSVKMIYSIAQQSVQNLQVVGNHQPDLVRKIAETWPDWPGFIGAHQDNFEYQKETIRKFNVGGACSANVNGRWSNYATPNQPDKAVIGGYIERLLLVLGQVKDDFTLKLGDETAQLTERVYKIVLNEQLPAWMKLARALPDTGPKGSVDAWFEAVWALLCAASNGNPANLQDLRAIGGKTAKAKQARAGQQKLVGKEDGVIKLYLEKQFRQAFCKRFRNYKA